MQNSKLNKVKERLMILSPTVQGGLEPEMSTKDFEILSGLGAGAFGRVYKCRHKKSKELFAAQKMVNQIKNEIKIMYLLEHENIIKLYNHFEEEEYIYLVIECATGGQLWHKLNEVGRFDEDTDIASAVEYLHSKNPAIIHRDIKPENLLLSGENRVKLADFGWSTFFNSSKRVTYCGTLDYLAPEMIQETGHDKSLDLWSLGVLIFELLTGKAPFAPSEKIKNQKDQQKALEKNIMTMSLDFPNDFPQFAKDLVLKLLKKNPNERMGLEEMKTHPWMKPADTRDVSPKKGIFTPIKSNLAASEIEKDLKPILQKNFNKNDLKMINTDEDGFTAEQIVQIANKGSIINIAGDIDNKGINEESTINDTSNMNIKNSVLTQSDDIKRRTIEDLSEKIRILNKEKRLKCNEFEQFKQEIDKNNLPKNAVLSEKENHRVRLLEEEKNNLKKEFDQLWETLKQKENILKKQEYELKKLEEIQKDVEKYKSEKNALNDKIKKLQEQLEEKDLQMNEMKANFEEEKLQLEFKLKELQMKGFRNSESSGDIQGIISKEFKNVLEELKKKINSYKEASEYYDQMKNKIRSLEMELAKMKAEKESDIHEIQVKLSETHEEEIEKLKNEYKTKIMEIQEISDKKVKEYDEMIENFRKENKTKLVNLNELEQLKLELKLEKGMTSDIKSEYETLKKLKSKYEEKMKEQDEKIKDQEEIIRKIKKK